MRQRQALQDAAQRCRTVARGLLPGVAAVGGDAGGHVAGRQETRVVDAVGIEAGGLAQDDLAVLTDLVAARVSGAVKVWPASPVICPTTSTAPAYPGEAMSLGFHSATPSTVPSATYSHIWLRAPLPLWSESLRWRAAEDRSGTGHQFTSCVVRVGWRGGGPAGRRGRAPAAPEAGRDGGQDHRDDRQQPGGAVAQGEALAEAVGDGPDRRTGAAQRTRRGEQPLHLHSRQRGGGPVHDQDPALSTGAGPRRPP
ncbi:hypothetical protein GCM10022630_33000 [Thermobifida alba]